MLFVLANFLLASHAVIPSESCEADFCVPMKGNIAFGSCNNPLLHPGAPNHIWSRILEHDPVGFFWMGDATYRKKESFFTKGWYEGWEGLDEAYKIQESQPEYQHFLKNIPYLYGTWDDHDFGINDGSSWVPYKDLVQQRYLDFLGLSPDHKLRLRKGVYSSHLIGSGNRKIKVILLDTRYFRGTYYIPSVAWLKIPLSALIACFTRLMSSYFRQFSNDEVLGEEQWSWLEEQLRNSNASAHIIVSSIQVFTSFPLTESWMHFPQARLRLIRLLEATAPQRPVFLSGDVHFAEVLGGESAVEITTSGMTHTIGRWSLVAYVAESLLGLCDSHRIGDVHTQDLNFGILEEDFTFTVYNEHNEALLSTKIDSSNPVWPKHDHCQSLDMVITTFLALTPLTLLFAYWIIYSRRI